METAEPTQDGHGGRRQGAGRPKKPHRIVTLRLSEPMYNVLTYMAKQAGVPLATFMQGELLKVAKSLANPRAARRRHPRLGRFPQKHWKDVPVIDI